MINETENKNYMYYFTFINPDLWQCGLLLLVYLVIWGHGEASTVAIFSHFPPSSDIINIVKHYLKHSSSIIQCFESTFPLQKGTN